MYVSLMTSNILREIYNATCYMNTEIEDDFTKKFVVDSILDNTSPSIMFLNWILHARFQNCQAAFG